MLLLRESSRLPGSGHNLWDEKDNRIITFILPSSRIFSVFVHSPLFTSTFIRSRMSASSIINFLRHQEHHFIPYERYLIHISTSQSIAGYPNSQLTRLSSYLSHISLPLDPRKQIFSTLISSLLSRTSIKMGEPPKKRRRADSLRRVFDDIEEENVNFHKENDRLKQENEELKLEHETILRPIGRIANERDALKQENGKLREADSGRRETIMDLCKSKGQMEVKISLLEEQLEQKMKENKQAINYNDLKQEMEMVQTELTQLKSIDVGKTTTINELTRKTKELEQKRKEEDVAIKSLRENEQNINQYKRKVEKLTIDISKLKSASSLKDGELFELKSTQSKISENLSAIRNTLSEVSMEKLRFQEKTQVFEEENICLKRQLKEAKEAVQANNTQSEVLKSLNTEVASLKRAAGAYEQELTKARYQTIALENKCDQYKADLEDGAESKRLTIEIVSLKRAASANEKELKNVSDEKENLSTLLETSRREEGRWKVRYEQERAEVLSLHDATKQAGSGNGQREQTQAPKLNTVPTIQYETTSEKAKRRRNELYAIRLRSQSMQEQSAVAIENSQPGSAKRKTVPAPKDARELAKYKKIFSIQPEGLDKLIEEIIRSVGQCGIKHKTKLLPLFLWAISRNKVFNCPYCRKTQLTLRSKASSPPRCGVESKSKDPCLKEWQVEQKHLSFEDQRDLCLRLFKTLDMTPWSFKLFRDTLKEAMDRSAQGVSSP